MSGEHDEDDAPKAKPRINERMGLRAMAQYVTGLTLRTRMSDGAASGEAWLLLEPADVEALNDIAETLDFFYLQRARERQRGRR